MENGSHLSLSSYSLFALQQKREREREEKRRKEERREGGKGENGGEEREEISLREKLGNEHILKYQR